MVSTTNLWHRPQPWLRINTRTRLGCERGSEAKIWLLFGLYTITVTSHRGEAKVLASVGIGALCWPRPRLENELLTLTGDESYKKTNGKTWQFTTECKVKKVVAPNGKYHSGKTPASM